MNTIAAKALVEHEPNEPVRREIEAPAVAMTPMALVQYAIQSGQPIDIIREVMALGKELKREQAREAFDAAMAAAKAEIPTIIKNRNVDFTGKTGLRTNYRHEDLGEIARTVDPILSRHGLSYRFRTEQQEGGAVRVICMVTHRDGHFEENALTAGRDESGNKNNIQAVGSTITYLQRYTLKAALGLAASNDDDAKSSGDGDGGMPISEEQAARIRALVEETGTDIARFCMHMGVEAVPEITVGEYPRAIAALEKKRTAK